MLRSLIALIIMSAIAASSMAAVTLTGSASGLTATVGYNYDGTGARPRAFALVVQATGGTITSITPAKTGTSTAASQGFGIFPGTIEIDTDGNVTSYGSPVEPTALPGGPSALGTSRVVVAMGSLYKGDANKPADSATLFTVICSAGTTALSVAPETTNRKGVVGEDGTLITVAPLNIMPPPIPAAPTGVAASDGPAGGSTATTITITWNASEGATSYDVYKSFQNSTMTAILVGTGNQTSPFVYVTGTTQTNAEGRTTYFWVKAKNASGTSGFSAGDSGYTTECVKDSTPWHIFWVNFGRPNCWCYQRNCRGDADGIGIGNPLTGYRWITSEDLSILVSGFNKLEPEIQTITRNGVPAICADFNRTRTGLPLTGYRWVTSEDLTILAQYFNVLLPTVPPCSQTNYNFWKN